VLWRWQVKGTHLPRLLPGHPTGVSACFGSSQGQPTGVSTCCWLLPGHPTGVTTCCWLLPGPANRCVRLLLAPPRAGQQVRPSAVGSSHMEVCPSAVGSSQGRPTGVSRLTLHMRRTGADQADLFLCLPYLYFFLYVGTHSLSAPKRL